MMTTASTTTTTTTATTTSMGGVKKPRIPKRKSSMGSCSVGGGNASSPNSKTKKKQRIGSVYSVFMSELPPRLLQEQQRQEQQQEQAQRILHPHDCLKARLTTRDSASSSTASSSSSNVNPLQRYDDKSLPLDFFYTFQHETNDPTVENGYDVDILRAIRSNDLPTLRRYHDVSATTMASSSTTSTTTTSTTTSTTDSLSSSPAATKMSKSKNLQYCCNAFGESILHLSCRLGHVEIVKFLLHEVQVPLHIVDDMGRTPLHDAFWTSTPNTELITTLLKHPQGPKLLYVADKRNHTPLHYTRHRHWSIWNTYIKSLPIHYILPN